MIVIACICPGSSSADHSVNTLRYADRLKQKRANQAYNYPKESQEELKPKKIEWEILPFNESKKKAIKKSESKQNLESGRKYKNNK